MNAMLELKNVSKTFASVPPVQPLCGLDLAVAQGEVACVTGVSGKGKSTLLNVAGGIMRPDCGEVLFLGENLAKASSRRLDELHRCGIGFIFQTPHVYNALTAYENLAFACRMRGEKPDETLIRSVLEEFGLADRADHMPHELSVGQRRRLTVARTCMGSHKLILADEPTNDLDAEWSDYVFDRFRAFAAAGGAVVVVTHDETYAQRADTVYTLEDGKLALRK